MYTQRQTNTNTMFLMVMWMWCRFSAISDDGSTILDCNYTNQRHSENQEIKRKRTNHYQNPSSNIFQHDCDIYVGVTCFTTFNRFKWKQGRKYTQIHIYQCLVNEMWWCVINSHIHIRSTQRQSTYSNYSFMPNIFG